MGGWHEGVRGWDGDGGGPIPRTNKAALTSCGTGPACALTRPGNLHPPAAPCRGGRGMMGMPCCGREAEAGFGGAWGGCPSRLPGARSRGRRKFCFSGNGPCCVSGPFVPLCPRPPAPGPAAGPHLGLRGDGDPSGRPLSAPAPSAARPPLLPAGCAASPGGAEAMGVGWEKGGG